LATYWEAIHKILEGRFTEIQATFGKSCTVLEHEYTNKFLYYGLEGEVSRAGFSFKRFKVTNTWIKKKILWL